MTEDRAVTASPPAPPPLPAPPPPPAAPAAPALPDPPAVGLDPVIHAEARLRITAALAAVGPGDSLSFPRLQKLLDMTAGNLSTHLRKLEDAGYVQVSKTFVGRTPATYLALTHTGRSAFAAYTRALRVLLGRNDTP
jgi:DNA-binding transcriptional ArsR family regulator